LTLLLELLGQLVLLDRTPLWLLAAGCWPFVSSRKIISGTQLLILKKHNSTT